jgi:flap endonuclease-1
MGIKNLNSFITKYAKDGITDINISTLSGKAIAIDTSIFMYKFMYSHKFIDSFIQQIYHFRTFKITPIYIFDGQPPQEKQDILDERKEVKNKNETKINDLELKIEQCEDIEMKKKLKKDLVFLKRKCINITKEDIKNLKNVFDILGVNYIQPNCEADLICCELFKNNKVYACMSNDMDFLASGAGLLLRNYNLSNNLQKYNLNIILQKLNFTYDKFVDFCILCGCDYTCKIPRMGSERAFEAIKNYNDIENIIENLGNKYKVPNNFEYKKARQLLKNMDSNLADSVLENFEIKNHIKFGDLTSEGIDYIHGLTKYSRDLLVNKIMIITT